MAGKAPASVALQQLQESAPVFRRLRRTHAGNFEEVTFRGWPAPGQLGEGAVGKDAVGGELLLACQVAAQPAEPLEELLLRRGGSVRGDVARAPRRGTTLGLAAPFAASVASPGAGCGRGRLRCLPHAVVARAALLHGVGVAEV